MDKKTGIQLAAGLALIVIPTAFTAITVHLAGKELDKRFEAMRDLDKPSVKPIIVTD